MATRARTRGPRRWPTSRPTTCASWWRPTSPPAAWISTSCPMWSTTNCPTSRKTTSTASAVPAEPDAAARRSRWWRRTKKLLKAIEKMTRQRIPDGDAQGFDPEAVLPGWPSRSPRAAEAAAPRQGTAQQPRAQAERRPGEQPRQQCRCGPGRYREAGRQAPPSWWQEQGNREAGQAQQPRQSREARPAKPNRPPEVDGNRDPEEFLDDDFDNFGNRADYVSPYQGQENKGRGRRGGQQKPQGGTGQQGRGQGQGQARGKSQGAAQGGARGQVPARARRRNRAPASRAARVARMPRG